MGIVRVFEFDYFGRNEAVLGLEGFRSFGCVEKCLGGLVLSLKVVFLDYHLLDFLLVFFPQPFIVLLLCDMEVRLKPMALSFSHLQLFPNPLQLLLGFLVDEIYDVFSVVIFLFELQQSVHGLFFVEAGEFAVEALQLDLLGFA
jgi:hypothetical protein